MTAEAPLGAPRDPYAHLTPEDQRALCARFSIPTPTPDVPFRVCVESMYHGGTIEGDRRTLDQWLYDQLRGTTDVRLMIAAHALRCGVVVLPRDAQLDPKPLPPLRHAPPRRAANSHSQSEAAEVSLSEKQRVADVASRETPKSRTRVPPGHVLTRLAPNPRKPRTATWERYELYALGLTVEQLVERGVTRGDVVWDLNHDYVAFSAPPSPTTAEPSPQVEAQVQPPEERATCPEPK